MMEQFLRNRRLIMHYYIVAGVAALLFGWSARNGEAMDPVILIILAVYVLVFPVVIVYTRKYAVHIFLFLLAFITGFYKKAKNTRDFSRRMNEFNLNKFEIFIPAYRTYIPYK